MILVRIALASAAAGLTASIVWASGQASVIDAASALWADAWGRVTLIDLYAGFLVSALAIAVLEPRRWLGIALACLVFVLGNVVTAGWLAWRAPMLVRRLATLQRESSATDSM